MEYAVKCSTFRGYSLALQKYHGEYINARYGTGQPLQAQKRLFCGSRGSEHGAQQGGSAG